MSTIDMGASQVTPADKVRPYSVDHNPPACNLRALIAAKEFIPAKTFREGAGEIAGKDQISERAWYLALNNGEVEGQFRIGRRFFIACAPWRKRFGINSTESEIHEAA